MKKPSLSISLIPVVLLIVLLSVSIYLFGDNMLTGPSQIVLMFVVGVAAAIAMLVYKKSWSELESSMVESIGHTMPANLILLLVGAVCATWMHSGIIPSMIYYGLEVISPRWFLFTASIICSLVSLCIGSSWTTIATVGVGLMGIGQVLGISDGWIAGAIISGAYFGDKMSPLSETTNLASSIAGVDLFAHIKNMLKTTVPSITITLIIFLVIGLMNGTGVDVSMESTEEMQRNLAATFNISPWLIFVPLLIFYLIYKGMPAVIVLFIGTVIAGLLIPIAQPQILSAICGREDGILLSLEAPMRAAFGDVSYDTGDAKVNDLISTSGMYGMLKTIWLIISSMCFGGVMEASGMLSCITNSLLNLMKGRVSTVTTTCLSSIFLNTTTGDQCLAIILPAKMYGQAYDQQNLERKLLSRTVEDGGTVTSVLIPWNSCGMTQSTMLGVSTFVYAPYCIFCWISPLMTIAASVLVKRKAATLK